MGGIYQRWVVEKGDKVSQIPILKKKLENHNEWAHSKLCNVTNQPFATATLWQMQVASSDRQLHIPEPCSMSQK